MNRRRFFANTALAGLGTWLAGPAKQMAQSQSEAIEVKNGTVNPQVKEAVLFPFDDQSIPFSEGLRLHLVSGKTPGKPNPIVVSRGKPGAPDDEAVRFYGTVIPFADELRMWYLGRSSLDQDKEGQLRVCCATSRDGLRWEKPRLGLVEFNASKANNIVNIRGGRCEFAALPVIFDATDPDPKRRYKLAFESWVYKNQLAVAYSADGLNWTESPNNPVGPNLEHTGLIKFDGCYYVNGHGGSHFGRTRKMVTHASYDFELWTRASCLSFRRDNVPPRPVPTEWNNSEEVHLGAGLWDRGNVILGVYDMWHASPTSDRTFVAMDLGLVISHNALQYHESIPDFRLVPAYEELIDYSVTRKDSAGVPIPQNEYAMKVPLVRAPSLSHGQGMANLGDKTFLWYEVWGSGDIRAATWTRDRLGYFRLFHPEGQSALPRSVRHCITCPLRAVEGSAKAFVNVAGLSEHNELTVELLDEQFRPVDGYSGKACVPIRQSGLRQPVVWKDRDKVQQMKAPFRLRFNFGGIRPEDIEFYAAYMTG